MPDPLHVDPDSIEVDGEALVRAEQCIALLQRRLIKPMSRGGPRSELTLTQYHAMSFLATRGQASVAELKEMLGFAQSTTSVLVGRVSLDEAMQQYGDTGLDVLACGPTPPNPSELLQSAAMEKLLGELRDRYDIVILDAPPLLPVTDAALLATQVDGAVVVDGNSPFLVGGSGDAPRLDRPGGERDRPVPARGAVSGVVEEDDT